MQISVTALLLFIDPSETRRTLPRPPGTPITQFGVVAAVLLVLVLIGMMILAVRPFVS
jgi:hypothetical protein